MTTANSFQDDEIQAIKDIAKQDNRRLSVWRLVVSMVLLAAGSAITVQARRLLQAQETIDFETAFAQFSKTLADASRLQTLNLRAAVEGLADVTSGMMQASTEVDWPFLTIPNFQKLASKTIEQGALEIIGIVVHVKEEQKDDYIKFSNSTYRSWVQEIYDFEPSYEDMYPPVAYKDYLVAAGPTGLLPLKETKDAYLPLWLHSPPVVPIINWDVTNVPDYASATEAAAALSNEVVFTRIRPFAAISPTVHSNFHDVRGGETQEHPHAFAFFPIRKDVSIPNSEIVAFLFVALAWDASLRRLVPDGVSGLQAVVKNSCGDVFTYQIDGPEAFFLGNGDFHETKFDKLKVDVDLGHVKSAAEAETLKDVPGHCLYKMTLYPTEEFRSIYTSRTPDIYSAIVALTFILVASVFFVYDVLVQRHNYKLVITAADSRAVVSSIIPRSIQERLGGSVNALSSQESDSPLADLFLEATLLRADISGFTSWSSVREPTHIFILLETLFRAFDAIAREHNVFRIETVGDVYVAATGIPYQRDDDAPAMIQFATKILDKSRVLFNDLVVRLGPDTGDLNLRIGIHSGPATGGLIRGSRFQLLGNSMNHVSQVEASGVPGRIHVSSSTVERLHSRGKHSWVEMRPEKAFFKGQGELQTYFVTSGMGETPMPTTLQEDRIDRLIDWNVQHLLKLVRQVVARREASAQSLSVSHAPSIAFSGHSQELTKNLETDVAMNGYMLDDVKEVIFLPRFERSSARVVADSSNVTIQKVVEEELRLLVSEIAAMYKPVPFHSFYHASHVTMSVTKLLARIVAPNITDLDEKATDGKLASALHDHTYGITSDPLTQLACVFSAIIHDAIHQGVSNSQVVKESPLIAQRYHNRSVAEQISLTFAWDLFMQPRFAILRKTICQTNNELFRFRELVLNCVLATDIADKDLKELRNQRWEKAFSDQTRQNESPEVNVNRKATIVLEYLMQASDVSHTMQHWHVYRKWNECFFVECRKAFEEGRGGDKDPALTWYKGELGFYDYYIIPLAKKLKDCGVFGKASDEYLTYALANRAEWELKGRSIVEEMTESYDKVHRATAKVFRYEDNHNLKAGGVEAAHNSRRRSEAFC